MSDDEIIGIKSTAIKFKKNITLFVFINYLISFLLMFYIFKGQLGLNILTIFFAFFVFSLIYQLVKFKNNRKKDFLKIFKINNYSGLFLFLGIISGNL